MSRCHCRREHVCQPGTEQDMIGKRERLPMMSRAMTAFRDLTAEEQVQVVAEILLNRVKEKHYYVTAGEIDRALDSSARLWVHTKEGGAILSLESKKEASTT